MDGQLFPRVPHRHAADRVEHTADTLLTVLDTLLTVLDTLLTVLDTVLTGRMANSFHTYHIGTLLDVLGTLRLYRESFGWTGNVEHTADALLIVLHTLMTMSDTLLTVLDILLTVLDTLLTVFDTLLTGWMANYFHAYRGLVYSPSILVFEDVYHSPRVKHMPFTLRRPTSRLLSLRATLFRVHC